MARKSVQTQEWALHLIQEEHCVLVFTNQRNLLCFLHRPTRHCYPLAPVYHLYLFYWQQKFASAWYRYPESTYATECLLSRASTPRLLSSVLLTLVGKPQPEDFSSKIVSPSQICMWVQCLLTSLEHSYFKWCYLQKETRGAENTKSNLTVPVIK